MRVLGFRSLADSSRPRSLANRLRRRRFDMFRSLLAKVPRPVRILDVGGTLGFWEQTGFLGEPDTSIVLLNLEVEPVSHPHLISVAGDAAAMPEFRDGEFDVVVSNSVIEHLPTLALQRQMAVEVRRVGKRYFVQTPNRYFPFEPHFLFPAFQFLPRNVQVLLLTRFAIGWEGRSPDRADARRRIDAIRLLTASEMRALFPGAKLHRERFMGLTKSFIAYGGWS